MTLFALYQWVDKSIAAFQEPDYQNVFVGVFPTYQAAKTVADEHDIKSPDIRPVTVGEYISPYQ